jgi:hypothetical protein
LDIKNIPLQFHLEPIIPAPIDIPAVLSAIETELNNTVKAARDDFKKTTRTWLTRVDFILIMAQKRGQDLEAATGTNNKIFGYVTRGTRPHIIRPRRARVLRFMSGYRAKTIRRRIGSNAGGSSGSPVFSSEVHHPGSQGREFEEAIAEKYQVVLQKRLQDTLNKALGIK